MNKTKSRWGARHIRSDLDYGPLVKGIVPGGGWGEGRVGGFGRAKELADGGSESRHCDERSGLGG